MTNIILSLALVFAVIFVIVFLVFKSDNATLVCKDLSELITDDCVIKIKICKRRKGNYGKRND